MRIVQFPPLTPLPPEIDRSRPEENPPMRLSELQTAILNCLPAQIAILDRTGWLVAVNDHWRRLAAENGDGNGITDTRCNYLEVCRAAAAAGDQSALRAMNGIAAVLNSKLPGFEMEYLGRSPTEQRWFRLTVIPVDVLGGAVMVHYDVTQEKVAHEALQKARVAAEAASRAKNEFVANMSHEIRTPLQGVLGMLDLVLDTETTAEQRAYLQTARSAAETLSRVMMDVLDFSRIESGKLSIEPGDLSLRSLIAETLAPLRLEGSQKGLRLEAHLDPDIPDSLIGDAIRIRQVITNLVDNAIKFTEAGGISVRIQREKVVGEEIWLRFAVSDSGIGIAPHKMNLIFEPFAQVDGSTTRRYGGSGLGLTIAAKLIELMGGRLSAESRLARGSTFHFSIRLRVPDQRASPGRPGVPAEPVPVEPRAAPIRPLQILVVDDSRFNVLFTTALLTKEGHIVSVANSGSEALSAVAEKEFGLILMDVQMPDMDGLQATAAIRDRERSTGGHVPILAMTARAMKEDQRMCLRAGMDAYICKPVSAEALLEAIADLVPPEPQLADEEVETPAGLLDREALLAEVGGDPQILRRLMGIFAQETERRLGELRTATGDGNAMAVGEAAHALKGMIGHWGKGSAFEAARRLEERAAAGDPADSGATESLAREIAKLQRELDELFREKRQ